MSNTLLPPPPIDPTPSSVEANQPHTTPPIDWELAFKVLVASSCRGLVSSWEVNQWVQNVHDLADPRAAQFMVAFFNKHRTSFEHGLMG